MKQKIWFFALTSGIQICASMQNMQEQLSQFSQQAQNALQNHKQEIASGIEQQVQSQEGLLSTQKQETEHTMGQLYAGDAKIAQYLSQYFTLFGTKTYQQSQHLFQNLQQHLQALDSKDFCNVAEIKALLATGEHALSSLQTSYESLGMQASLRESSVFSMVYYNLFDVYAYILQRMGAFLVSQQNNLDTLVELLPSARKVIILVLTHSKKQVEQYAQSSLLAQGNNTQSLVHEQTIVVQVARTLQTLVDTLKTKKDHSAQHADIFVELFDILQAFDVSQSDISVLGMPLARFKQKISFAIAQLLQKIIPQLSLKLGSDVTKNEKILEDICTYMQEIVSAYTLQPDSAEQVAHFRKKLVVYQKVQQSTTVHKSIQNSIAQFWDMSIQQPSTSALTEHIADLKKAYQHAADLEALYNQADLPLLVNVVKKLQQQIQAGLVFAQVCMYWREWVSQNSQPSHSGITSQFVAHLHDLSLLVGGKNPYDTLHQQNLTVLITSTLSGLQAAHFGVALSSDKQNLEQEQDMYIMQTVQQLYKALPLVQDWAKQMSNIVHTISQQHVDKDFTLQSILQVIYEAQRLDTLWNTARYTNVCCAVPYGSWTMYTLHMLIQIAHVQPHALDTWAGLLVPYIQDSTLKDKKIYEALVQDAAQQFSQQTLQHLQVQAHSLGDWKKQKQEAMLQVLNYIGPWFAASKNEAISEQIQRASKYLQESVGYVEQYVQHMSTVDQALYSAQFSTQLLSLVQSYLNKVDSKQEALQSIMSRLKSVLLACMSNSNGTGIINRLTTLQHTYTSTQKQGDVKHLQQIRTQIAALLQQYGVMINQQKSWTDFAEYMTDISVSAHWFAQVITNDDMTLSCKIDDQHHVSYTLANYRQYQPLQGVLDDMQTADTYAQKADFSKAAQLYAFVKTQLQNMLVDQASTHASDIQKKYYLAQTRGHAAGLAAAPCGYAYTTVSDLQNPVPSEFVVNSTQITVPSSYVNAQVIAQLKQAPKNEQGIYHPTLAQSQQVVQLCKLYIVYAGLHNDGFDPQQIFDQGTLQYAASVSLNLKQKAESYLDHAESVGARILQGLQTGLGEGENALHTQIAYMIDAQNNITLACANFPLGLIDPLYVGGQNAGSYFLGAHMLFKEGKDLLHLGPDTFVPGQLPQADDKVLQFIVDVYIAQALQALQKAEVAKKKLHSVVTSTNEFDTQSSKLYQTMKQQYLMALSLLADSQQSAVTYAEFDASLHTNVQQYVQSIYEQVVEALQSFLPDNPASARYSTILYDISGVLLEQEQAFAKQQAVIAQKRAQVFDTAAQACQQYHYMDPHNKRVMLYPYKAASSYYMGAQKVYSAVHMSKQAEAAQENVYAMYTLLSHQQLSLFFDAVDNGSEYTDDQGNVQHISFSDLQKSQASFYQHDGSMVHTLGQVQEYDRIKNLLLHAALYAQFASSYFTKAVKMDMKQETKEQTAFLKILEKQGIITKKEASLNFKDAAIRKSLLLKSAKIFKAAQGNAQYQSIWAQRVENALAYEYISVYLSQGHNIGSFDKVKLQNLWTQYFSILRTTGSALQNPTSAYIG